MVKVKIDKRAINKLVSNLEHEMNKQFVIRESQMKKDSEKFLQIVLDAYKRLNSYQLQFQIEEFEGIPNIDFAIGDILRELKLHSCIGEHSMMDIIGNITIYLTTDGVEYFDEKENRTSENSYTYINSTVQNVSNYGGINTIIQNNNSVDLELIKKMVSEIKEEIKERNKELAEDLDIILEDIEAGHSTPKRIQNWINNISTYISLGSVAAPAVTVALPKLIDYLKKFI